MTSNPGNHRKQEAKAAAARARERRRAVVTAAEAVAAPVGAGRPVLVYSDPIADRLAACLEYARARLKVEGP